ncbi:hypothetical protein HO173_012339 [Letharia columbiana]|uniref:Fe2OG dioxygenase domain-containing protein n=1 Tax=Letharia columbiana TaxID=112416 RepID=A0A8H6CP11_9LECA|nr:uncharacterized protein HO173_012339 [Letharia columbiana]KAF6226736.1 hypothetical protein HO173_012339 [Letharia columbiana]
MSSTGSIDENAGSEPSRRSIRERKQAQHFGHSEPNEELEELIEAPKPRKIAPAVRKGGKRASGRPSLWVKLPLPSQTPLLPSPRPQSSPEVKVENSFGAPPESSSQNSKKRSAALPDSHDESDLFAPSLCHGTTLKKQRLESSAPKQRAAPRAKVALDSDNETRPKPRGQPEVWAEMRQALCESLTYYQAYQSGAYTWGSSNGSAGYAYGFLLDNDNDDYGYMDEKVVITRLGGGMTSTKSGKMVQTEDQSSSSNKVTPFVNNQRDRVPVILIVGAKNPHCPTKVPHRYNVLGVYQVTDIWSEKVKGKVVCRVRFEMLDLKTPSWCGIHGSSLPTPTPDYSTKASLKTCTTCNTSSKEVSTAGWMCLNETCANFSIINGQADQEAPTWNPAFIDERNKWPAHIKAPLQLKPAPPNGLLNASLMETSLQAWKGMVCRDCGRCNSRTKWDEWKCETEGCTFEVPIHYPIIPRSQLAPDHAFAAEGHSIPFDKWEAPVVRTESEFHGYWRKATYEISPGNCITHYFANEVINRQPGGADEALEALQGTKLGMQRFPLENSPVEGEMITKHFGINFGLPYNYVVAVDSRGFSEAPPAIMDAVNHLTWAGKDAIKDGSYRPFNELLCLGYMEKQSIGWHDDGEKDLGPDIASWSLGGAATMGFRMKSKYWKFKERNADNYDPELPVRPGSQAWKERIALNELYQAGHMDEYEQAKTALFKALDKNKNNGPTVLSLELRHGDMVVMHGEDIQKNNEHGVMPKGKLRFGLTGRYIKPENIPVEEHWKGEFTIAPEKVYDGDLALFKANFPEEED